VTTVRSATKVVTAEVDDPLDLLPYIAEPDGVAWVRHGEGLVGWGEAARFDIGPGTDRIARGESAFLEWCRTVEVTDDLRLPGTGPVGFASFTFDPRSGGSVLVVPRIVLGRRDGRAWVTVIGEAPAHGPALQALPDTGRIRYAGTSLDELRWMEAVAAAVGDIRAGALDKVVLARDVRVWSETPLDTRVLARRLADRFGDCFTFVVDGLVGATPELLARRRGDLVESIVLAGSAARGGDEATDAQAGRTLAASEKDRWEHALAVRSVQTALDPLCVQLDVDPEPWLLRLANVQHLATTVRGRLSRTTSVLGLVAALHPTAAVCGTPTEVALDRIRALEGMERARYSGPVGWTDARGDGEFGIALRCAEVRGDRARLFAGAGIVGESLPEWELEETRLKLRAMQSALGDG
jgi:menaquinone-specific isochorismate synthase